MEKEEEVFDLFSRLLEHVRQMEKEQHGCHIKLVYVASGAQHVEIQHQHNHYKYYKEKKRFRNYEGDPYEALLLRIIEPLRNGRNWKAILLPYCAAVEEGVLPQWSHTLFVQKTGIAVPATSYSDWMRKDRFTEEELAPYVEQFGRLKREIDNSR